ncbi:hypothetical protein [Microcystis phage Mwe-JY13]
MKETNILKECLMALSKAGVMAFRCNTGSAWQGIRREKIERELSAKYGKRFVVLEAPRIIEFGLVKGGSDIVAVAPDGKFVGVETKTEEGRLTKEQRTFRDNIRRMGGRAGVARSAEEAVRIALDTAE